MSNIFQIKRRLSNSGLGGGATGLVSGELAFNEVDGTLYYGNVGGSSSKIAGDGSFITLDSPQTVTQSKTFTGAVSLGSAATTATQSAVDSSSAVASTAFVQSVAANLDGGSF